MNGRLILNVIFAAVAAACIAGIVVSRGSRAEYTITIGILASRDDEDYAGAEAFKRHVEDRAAGRVAVKIFTSGQYCGGERECVESLQSGVLDVFMTTFSGFGNFFGPGQAFDLPYLFPDDAVAECVLDGDLAAQLRTAVLDAGLGLHLMTIGNTGGWRDFASTRRPIRTPDDLKGLKIRTTPAPLEQQFVRQLGANPTPIAWSEIYLALATGVVDGTKNSIQDIVAMRLEEHIRHITIDRHAYMGAIWWFSDRRWRALPEDIRDILAEGFETLRDTTREMPKRQEAVALERFTSAGGVVVTPGPLERAAFRRAASGMRDWFVKTYGPEWLERIDAEIADCETRLAM